MAGQLRILLAFLLIGAVCADSTQIPTPCDANFNPSGSYSACARRNVYNGYIPNTIGPRKVAPICNAGFLPYPGKEDTCAGDDSWRTAGEPYCYQPKPVVQPCTTFSICAKRVVWDGYFPRTIGPASATVRCNHGFQADPNYVARCRLDNSWGIPSGRHCHRICNRTSVTNGYFPKTIAPAIARAVCHPGLFSDPNPKAMCAEDKGWVIPQGPHCYFQGDVCQAADHEGAHYAAVGDGRTTSGTCNPGYFPIVNIQDYLKIARCTKPTGWSFSGVPICRIYA
ncbi:uncharacterized protein LOC135812823 [Sycon ciliatum]|uniref:uncharacterized protein LOC135812823 n=1 Tax=Sycon ciliatum TaxID=27933 RepID=UPI0031F6DF5E